NSNVTITHSTNTLTIGGASSILALAGTTASTTTTTGALTVAGGVGIAGATTLGSTLKISMATPQIQLAGTEGSAKTAALYENAGTFNMDWSGNLTLWSVTLGTGAVRFNQYGAGTLTTDGRGNITATSDAD